MRRHTRELRQNQTEPERLLWSRLRRRQVGGFKFRRQHQIGLYICDFASVDGKVVVELDGSQHLDRIAYDASRDRFLASAGFRVLRFWNPDVMFRIHEVLDTIYDALHRPLTPPPP